MITKGILRCRSAWRALRAITACRRSASIICCVWRSVPIQCALRILPKRVTCRQHARQIQHEYKAMADAFHKEITPHNRLGAGKGSDRSKLASGPGATS